MKRSTVALFAVLSGSAFGAPVEGWELHGWSGYQPAATLAKETVDGRTVRHLSNVRGRSGGCILSVPRTACRAGDVVHVSFEAKGTGKGFATFARYAAKGGGYNQTSRTWNFDLTGTWTRHEFDFIVADGTSGATGSGDFQLGVATGGEAFFANADLEVVRCAFDGFEGEGPHAGDAEIIQGNIAPGLLSVTGLGLFRAASPRRIELPSASFRLPTSGDNRYQESSVRIYSFGRTVRRKATLDMKFAGEDGGEFALRIDHDPSRETLRCTLADRIGGAVAPCGRLDVPYGALPADFTLSASVSGEIRLEVKSLADSSVKVSRVQSAFFKGRGGSISSHLLFTPRDGEGELVIDNYALGRANPETRIRPVPFEIEKAPTFDPVAAGWPLVFADEFDGEKIDEGKWDLSRKTKEGMGFVKDGILHIRCDWDARHEKLQTASLWSKEAWEYGYFESRLRFTRNSGWWAAFWLCTHSCANPFRDGFEIDIFEDYYTRCDKPDGVHRPILDHNLHLNGSAILKSWNYRSTLPGSLDDFYVLGCKWTPFEISYYLNGKLIASEANHAGHKSVTFDMISHGGGFAPLRAIVSGQIMNDSWFCHDTTGFTFPEDFLVDYVRVYAYPQPDKPSVSIVSDKKDFFMKPGDRLHFDVRTAPAKDGAKVRTVYLFDSGYLLDYRTEPPYAFDVDITDDYYGATRYMRPGRSGKVTPLKGTGVHVFAAYAVDEKGRYAHSSETVDTLLCDYAASRPYRGVAQKIPGVVKCGLYDEGGPGVAYSDTSPGNCASKTFRTDGDVDAAGEASIGTVSSGEWLTYSVDVAETGDYKATFTYGTPFKGHAKLHLFVDGRKGGTFSCPAHEADHWGTDTRSVIDRITIPAGRHRLTILCEEGFNFATLEFEKVSK